jgi:hypothetical protein
MWCGVELKIGAAEQGQSLRYRPPTRPPTRQPARPPARPRSPREAGASTGRCAVRP